MNLKIRLLLVVLLLLPGLSLGAQISINISDKPLKEALVEIERVSDYNFFYSSSLPDIQAKVSLKANDASIEEIMASLLNGLSISYEIKSDKQITLFARPISTNQSRTAEIFNVTGVVSDPSSLAVIGAVVQVKGSQNAVITDYDGRYSIQINDPSAILEISCMGYSSQQINVGGRSQIDIILQEDKQYLDEVVVVGYGVQKKVNLTGSVAMISSDDISSRPISDVSSGLQGLLPGVTIVNPSGQPGVNSSTIRVRGIGTIGNANPLILIDGVEGDINTLNPEDIESVSVLKDAASSAIYGARAANGVLLVTTKRLNSGTEGSTRVSLHSYFGVQTPTALPQMCGAIDFMTLENEAKANVGTPPSWTEDIFEKVRTGSDPNRFGDTDWIGEVLNKYAPQQNYSVNINGSLGSSGYLLSYRYFDQQGLTTGKSTGSKSHNLRFKLSTQLLDRLTLNSNINFSNSDVVSPVNSLESGGGAIYNAMRIMPNAPLRYTDGSWAYGGGNTNPVAILVDGGRSTKESQELFILEELKLNILKGWDISASYNVTTFNALNRVQKNTVTFTNPDDNSVFKAQYPNSLKLTDRRYVHQTLIAQTNFDFSLSNHNISGVIGMSQEWRATDSFNASRTKLSTEFQPTLNLGDPGTMSNDASASRWAIRSGFGRLSYNFKERYLAEVNLRYDLSSRFHKSRRGGFFPSVSAGWRISEEPFMSFAKPVLDNFKLRASWGELGNQYVGSSDYPYVSLLSDYTDEISLIGGNATSAYVQSILANPNLTWEKIRMTDFGLDLALFSNRLTASFDYFYKDTEGILLQLNYPIQIGATPSEENAGKVNNTGWEMDLNWRDQIGELSYGIGFNLSDVKNKIVDLGGKGPDLSGDQIRIVGHPIDAFYGYIAEGLMMPEDFKICDTQNHIYQLPKIPVIIGNSYQPGDIKYKDISGPDGVPDGRITPEYDKVVIGSPIPRYTYSVRGNIEWKGFDMSFMLQGVGKCDGFLTGTARHALQDMAAYPQKVHLDRFNIVSNPNPNASYPRLTYHTGFNQNTFSTYWLEDASYLRLKNFQIGYTFPREWLSKARIDNLRIYFSGDNLLTFTKFFYAYDPETPVSKGGYYPQIKTLVLGLNLSFK